MNGNVAKPRVLASLLAIFLMSFMGNLVWLWHFRTTMSKDTLETLAASITRVHGVPLGVILGSLFVPGQQRTRVRRMLAIVAGVLSGVWAAYIAMAWSGYGPPSEMSAVGPDSVDAYMTARSGNISLLVSGLLAFVAGRIERASGSGNGPA